jgi:hypothetical protein
MLTMPVVKCPFCGKTGAFLDPEVLKASSLTCESITCKNPTCDCYDPITYGYSESMNEELKDAYERYIQAIKEESDI